MTASGGERGSKRMKIKGARVVKCKVRSKEPVGGGRLRVGEGGMGGVAGFWERGGSGGVTEGEELGCAAGKVGGIGDAAGGGRERMSVLSEVEEVFGVNEDEEEEARDGSIDRIGGGG